MNRDPISILDADGDLDAVRLAGYTPVSLGAGLVLLVADGHVKHPRTHKLVRDAKAMIEGATIANKTVRRSKRRAK
jgi:hypothetical protein